MNDFVTSCISHLGNVGSLNYADFPNACISSYKSHLLISPPISSEKSTQKMSSLWWQYRFSKTNFCLKAFILSLATLSFPWSERLIPLVFPENVCQIAKSKYHSLLVLSSKDGMPWRTQLIQFATQSHNFFSSRQHYSIIQQKWWIHASHCHRILAISKVKI